MVVDVVKQRQARRVVKSKSMLSEEIGINEVLEKAGVDVVETDLGEWIIQLAHETPSHLILPAIHKQRAGIQKLFEEENGEKLSPETKVLAGYARRRLRQKFQEAEVGITGCNFAIAETGSVVLFTNEGNGRMVTTLPDTHIVLMGMERIVPTWSDLEVMANLLPRSATGQKLTTYLNVISGPKGPLEEDGANEVHIIIVDNGRSKLLGDPEFQDVLHCIRCGACLNVCPVYRHIGGHAYGSVYSGPIGAVLTPLLRPTAPAGELANASTLCGACFEACPVKSHSTTCSCSFAARTSSKVTLPPPRRSPGRYMPLCSRRRGSFGWRDGLLGRCRGSSCGDGTRHRWLTRWIAPLRGWTDYRALPKPATRSLHAQWARGPQRSKVEGGEKA